MGRLTSQRRRGLRRTIALAAAGLATLSALHVAGIDAFPFPSEAIAAQGRQASLNQRTTFDKSISADPDFSIEGLGNAQAVSQAVGQSGNLDAAASEAVSSAANGRDADDFDGFGDLDDFGDFGKDFWDSGFVYAGDGQAVSDDLYAGHGYASNGDGASAGPEGASVGRRGIDLAAPDVAVTSVPEEQDVTTPVAQAGSEEAPPDANSVADGQIESVTTDAAPSSDLGSATSEAARNPVTAWTWEAGAFGCPGETGARLCSAKLSSTRSRPSTVASAAAQSTGSGTLEAPSRREASPSAATPTPAPGHGSMARVMAVQRRQFDSDAASASSEEADIFPQFTSYVTKTQATSSYVYFGPVSNLNTTYAPAATSRAVDDSGNGEAPTNINNPNSPDLGWLDTIVGAVPYKNGDLAASIVWLLATIALIPLLLIRLIRRSSLISSVLLTVAVFMVLMLAAFGIRAKLSDTTPTTSLMMAESIILAILLPLLLEPLIALLALYSKQSGRQTGVPTAAAVLRIVNLIVFILFLVAAAYDASWLRQWDNALQNRYTAQDLPSIQPPSVVRIAPVVAAIVELILILGTALLIPVARGDNGSMRPGGFIFILLVLLFIACIWRILQTLHATSRLSQENGGSGDDLLPFFSGGSSGSTTDDQRVANGLSLAPQGMYGPNSSGIAWEQLQLTMSSRNSPQTPLIFYLVYVLPMWLMVFLLFFVHAPGGKKGKGDDEGSENATATATATA